MENLKSTFKRYWISVVGAGVVLLIIAIFWLGGVLETKQFNRTVDNQQTQSNKAVREAINANNSAVNASIERRTEDAVRETTIKPKLTDVRRQSQISKAELDAAKRRYENAKINSSNLSSSDADNCRKLRELFPNTKFADCQ